MHQTVTIKHAVLGSRNVKNFLELKSLLNPAHVPKQIYQLLYMANTHKNTVYHLKNSLGTHNTLQPFYIS
jgi:hypothetical protein